MSQPASYDSDDDPIPSLEYEDDDPHFAPGGRPPSPTPAARGFVQNSNRGSGALGFVRNGYVSGSSFEEFAQNAALAREELRRKAWSSAISGHGYRDGTPAPGSK